MLNMGGVILGKSTSEESEKLSLAIYALSEVATKKLKSRSIILLEDDLDVFCNLILSRDEEKQIQLINNLCNQSKSTDLLIEELIPKTADKLGNMWKQDQVSFIDVSFDLFKIFDLVIFNCFFTIAQISELVFSANDKQGSLFFCGFISSAYVIACSIGLLPVCFFTP